MRLIDQMMCIVEIGMSLSTVSYSVFEILLASKTLLLLSEVKMLLKILVCCAVCTGLFGCETDAPQSTEDFDLRLLVGIWEDISENSQKREEWQWVGENHLRGKGFVLMNNDTTFIESLEIKEVDDTLRYLARIPGQIDEYAVIFTLNSKVPNKLLFENAAYKYPQRIAYVLESQIEMRSYIEGEDHGDYRKVESWYHRKGQ